MSIVLYELIGPHEQDLVDHLVRCLKSSTWPHYQEIDVDLLIDRSARLVEVFLVSLDEDPGAFVAYVRGIAEERIAEGYLLHEIVGALGVLERKAWQIVTAELPPQDQVVHLSRVSGTVGAAKNALARIYLNHKEIAEAEVARLVQKIDQLTRCTDIAALLDRGDAVD